MFLPKSGSDLDESDSLLSVLEKLLFRRQLHFLLFIMGPSELESSGSDVLKAEAGVDSETL